jgi:hypothetical protein
MKAEVALRMIADGHRLPCRKCGEVHQPHLDPNNPAMAPQWAAEDGHSFYEMTPAEFARIALNDGTVPNG